MSSIIKVDTIQNQSGANIISENSNTITVGASGDTITVPSGATHSIAGTLSGSGTVDLSSATVTLNDSMKMTPFFHATIGSTQSISHATNTKIAFNSEITDTDSAYDNSNYKFTVPSGQGGTYFFQLNVNLHDFSTNDAKRVIVRLYKNGGTIVSFHAEHQAANDGSAGHRTSASTFLVLAAGDYIEPYVYQNSGNSYNLLADQADNNFAGFKVIK